MPFSSLVAMKMYRTVKSTDKGPAGPEAISTFDDTNANMYLYDHFLLPSPPTTLQTPKRGSFPLSMESYSNSPTQEYTPKCSTLGRIDTKVNEHEVSLHFTQKHKMLENSSWIKSTDSDRIPNLEFTLGK
ncbi:hypothetical protein L1987_47221 [Smallanthus sonchifolius]|uniref:Uncharacterized protein n=1 Tax=Smallanthus sonchifolius TaxID=185202 RepID=A0ACB9G2X3_9ASTR|nr:hypothetical protein L1987_47221 [Smallanthus sonchifolius]